MHRTISFLCHIFSLVPTTDQNQGRDGDSTGAVDEDGAGGDEDGAGGDEDGGARAFPARARRTFWDTTVEWESEDDWTGAGATAVGDEGPAASTADGGWEGASTGGARSGRGGEDAGKYLSTHARKIVLDFGGQTPKAFFPGESSGPVCYCDNISQNEKCTQASFQLARKQGKEKRVRSVKAGKKGSKELFKISNLSDSQLSAFCGVTRNVLKFLAFKIKDSSKSHKVDQESRVFLTLSRLKSCTSFPVLGSYFGISASLASSIFRRTLNLLHEIARENLIWLDRKTVKSRLPKAFQANFGNVRVIIDCSEVKCERPSSLRQRVLTYSQYKSGHTVKFLVGIAPSGEITYISSAYGGRATDTEITANSGLIELLEEGDVVLGDKGFPTIEREVENIGAFLVMPPFRSGNRQMTAKQNKDGYEIASVRVHVERAIQRMKRFKCLHFVPILQMEVIDKILVIVAFLCNLLPDLIRE